MKKIAFIIGSMNRGGAERVISILANQFISVGYKVDIIMLLDNGVGYELSEKINLIDFTTKRSRLNSLPYWLKEIRKYTKNNIPDTIVSFAARINIITLIATKGIKVPVIVSERNDPYSDGRSKLIDILTNYLYPKSKAVVFQTKRAKEYFNKKIQNKGLIITNPISVHTKVKNISKKKIVNVGRYTEQKNQKLLINAFSKISSEYPEYKLHLYGEGELRDELTKQIKKLKLEDKVILEGNVTYIHEEISDAQFFVLSSNYEGLSNALLEAMMMGIPCISTDCAGSDEYIVNGKTGILVPTNDEDRLYIAMKDMIENPALRKQISFEAKKYVEKCKVDNVIGQWNKILF